MKKFFALLLFTLLAAFSVNSMASSQCSAPNPISDHWPPNLTVDVSNDIVATPVFAEAYSYSMPEMEVFTPESISILHQETETALAYGHEGLYGFYLDGYIRGFIRNDKTLNPVLCFKDMGEESNNYLLINKLDQFRWPFVSHTIAESNSNYQLGKS